MKLIGGQIRKGGMDGWHDFGETGTNPDENHSAKTPEKVSLSNPLRPTYRYLETVFRTFTTFTDKYIFITVAHLRPSSIHRFGKPFYLHLSFFLFLSVSIVFNHSHLPAPVV
jgi:hypothetical protein